MFFVRFRYSCPDGEGHSGRPGPDSADPAETRKGREGPFPQEQPSTPQGGDILLIFPESSAGLFRRRDPGGQETAAPCTGCGRGRDPDGLDERHFDRLEDADLSLRAALNGWKTVEIRGAGWRPLSAEENRKSSSALQNDSAGCRTPRKERSDMFKLQLAAGNARYVFL